MTFTGVGSRTRKSSCLEGLRSSVVEVSGSGCSWEELNCWDELGLGLWLGEAGSGRNSGGVVWAWTSNRPEAGFLTGTGSDRK